MLSSHGGMSVSFDLDEDVKISNTDKTTTYKVIEEILVSMDVYIKKSNESKPELIVEGDYVHQQKETECNIKFMKISFGSPGAAALDLVKFVMTNSKCVTVSNYSKLVGGGTLIKHYVFK